MSAIAATRPACTATSTRARTAPRRWPADVADVALDVPRAPADRDARHHRRRARAQSAVPAAGARRPRARRPRHGPLQPHDPGRARARRISPHSSRPSRSRSSRRCPAISRTMSTASAARACSSNRSAACSGSTRSATAATARASCSISSTIRRARRCRRRRRRSRPTTSACSASATASCSTGCSRSPTCRSSASARCWSIKGEFDRYLDVLRGAHADANLDGVMCRNLISVDWRGYVYDCDFNQMLDLPLARGAQAARPPLRPARRRPRRTTRSASPAIAIGCTAGQGSSCGGALAAAE